MTNKLMKNKYTPAVYSAMPDPTEGKVSFHSRVFPTRKSDSFHNGISTSVTESRTHTKETQIKETCSGKTEKRSSVISYIFNCSGKLNAGKASLKS